MRCKYCIYHEGNGGYREFGKNNMTFEVAKLAIDQFLTNSKKEQLYISFYGGEPLICYDMIKQCTKYCLKVYPDQNICFTMTTNELYINILSLVQSIVAVLAIYAVIININRVLFLFILAVPIISTGANIFIGRKQYDLLKKRTSRNRKLSYINYLLTNNIAIKEILSYECHNYLISKFKKINEDILDENNKFLKLRTVINFILSFFEELVSISMLIWCGSHRAVQIFQFHFINLLFQKQFKPITALQRNKDIDIYYQHPCSNYYTISGSL